MKPEVEMYFTNPIDLSKKYYTQLSQVKHSQTDNGIKYIISPSFTISLLCIIFYFLSICIILPIWIKPLGYYTLISTWKGHVLVAVKQGNAFLESKK